LISKYDTIKLEKLSMNVLGFLGFETVMMAEKRQKSQQMLLSPMLHLSQCILETKLQSGGVDKKD